MTKKYAMGIDIGGTNTAFGLVDEDGNVIAEGKIADLILLNFEDLNLFPCHDVEENLVYSAHGSNVVMNMARGKVI